MSNWKEYKIGDIITLEYGKSLKDYRDGLGMYDVFGTNGRIGTTNYFLYDKPSVIIGRKGAYREVHLAKNPFFVIDTAFYTKNKLKNINTLFLYYWFKNVDINSMDSGSAIPSTSRDEVYDLDIWLPPIKSQNRIAKTLKCLDEKIDLLHSQNQTLEQLAGTLFRQWFVVEANENSEILKISDVAFINRQTISKDYTFQEIQYLDTGSITRGVVSEYQTFNLREAPSRAQRIVNDNDIVYSLVRPIQRHYGLLKGIKPNTIASTGFCVVTPNNFSSLFLYLLLTRDETVEYLEMIAEGSTSAYPSLKPSDIANFEFSRPSEFRLAEFENYATDAWSKISKNKKEIGLLAELRDMLLPKLLNGELIAK